MKESYQRIPYDKVDPSKTNPRKNFPPEYINELGNSIFEKGVLEPLLVRPKKGKKGRFEIVAGECRYRGTGVALKLAKDDQKRYDDIFKLPCLVNEMSDADAMEIQAMENIHRKDLTPLEEAAAYRNLIDTKPDKHSATTIAQRVGKSPSWVWDIMKCLDLVPDAKKLLESGLMTVNHAIPIARLKPHEQKAVIDPGNGGLFTHDSPFDFEGQERVGKKEDPWEDCKPRSVRELHAYIAHHFRFDAKQAAKTNPLQFEKVAEAVTAAEKEPGRGKKVIPITYDYQLHPDARDSEERTYTQRSWKRADGTKGTSPNPKYGGKPVDSPTCEYAVLGTVVVGSGYGQAFKVCVARDKCKIHWGSEIKAKSQPRSSGNGSEDSKALQKAEAEERKRQKAMLRKQAEYDLFAPALKSSALATLDTLTTGDLPKATYAALLKYNNLPADTKPANLAQALLAHDVKEAFGRGGTYWLGEQIQWATALGLDVKKVEKEAIAPLDAKEVVVDKDFFEKVRNSYSGDIISNDKPSRVRNPFKWNGELMIAVGGESGQKTTCYRAYQLVPRSEYSGKTCDYHKRTEAETAKARNARRFYHGMLVNLGSQEHVLVGPEKTFYLKGKDADRKKVQTSGAKAKKK